MLVIAINTPTPNASNAPSRIVINEFCPNPEGSDRSGGEWIEIYNAGPRDMEITTWYISDQDGEFDFVFPSDTYLNVSDYILGYTCLNDVTARDLQKKDIQWTRAKSFDTFCPLGPWLETDLDTKALEIKLYLNGKLKQRSSTRNFIFSVGRLVAFVSRVMTLFPGDIISTGTPSGVGRMERRDKVEIEISGIGKLANPVA